MQENTTIRNKEKQLMRRKSELPHDTGIVRALVEHKRVDEFLTTPSPDAAASTLNNNIE